MEGMPDWKQQWQLNKRREFVKKHGYSLSAYYATGGLRSKILKRDGYKCRHCGMSDQEHKERWNRPITIDHIDQNRNNNTMENLQTLCLSCHGKKDISLHLIVPRVPKHKETIIRMRKKGYSYQAIADEVGFSIGAIWKWVQRWEKEAQYNV